MRRLCLNVRSDPRRLREVEQKYRRLAALRARRDAVEAAGALWPAGEGAQRRDAFRALAADFPGALRELELPAARLAALADEVGAEAGEVEVTRPWVHLTATFHELLGEALAAKLWLARRIGRHGVVDEETCAAAGAALCRPLACAELTALHHPPQGRVVELVWRALGERCQLAPELVRALVVEHGGERRGWRWYVPLPGGRVWLVPVDESGARRLLRERRLLSALAPRMSFAVPVPLGPVEGPDVRRCVPGEAGGAIPPDELARLLAELHGAFAPHELAALGLSVDPEAYPLPEPRLRAVVGSLPAAIHARVHAALDRYAALDAPPDAVLTHGDVAAHNLAFDPATRRLVGIFDFESAAVRDRHHDLKYLPSYGPEVMARVLADYERLTGAAISVARVRLLHLATALSYWAWREADPAAHDRESGRDRDVALAWVGHALFHLDPWMPRP